MAQSKVMQMTQQEADDFYDQQFLDEAKKHLKETKDGNMVWDGVLKFIDWIRNLIKDVLVKQISRLPVVGTFASRVGVTISEFLFTCLGTFFRLLRVTFQSPQLWKKAHECAMRSWTSNEENGKIAQCYAYAKKMAAYFLEIFKQCLERSIIANGLELSSDEKDSISQMLDGLHANFK